MKMEGKIVDIHDRKIFGGGICISEGRIKDIYKF